MGDATADNETFPEITIDLPEAAQVSFRKCGDLKKEAGLPLSRECDDILGESMANCVGPSSSDCSNTFRIWSKLYIANF